jgi:hypothetical protein
LILACTGGAILYDLHLQPQVMDFLQDPFLANGA